MITIEDFESLKIFFILLGYIIMICCFIAGFRNLFNFVIDLKYAKSNKKIKYSKEEIEFFTLNYPSNNDTVDVKNQKINNFYEEK